MQESTAPLLDLDSVLSANARPDNAEQNSFASNIPDAPDSLDDAGLTASFVQDLMIKHLYRAGVLTGRELATHIHLPYLLIEPILEDIVDIAYAEKRGGQGLGASLDRFALTDSGKSQARDLLHIDTYIGAAPVPIEQYAEYVIKHDLNSLDVNEQLLRQAWRNFILDDELFAQIGPAICSGKSCFLYGPPGTGKTTIAKAIARLLDETVGWIAIPHAIIVGDSLIRIYDPVYHNAVKIQKENDPSSLWMNDATSDQRWVTCHRPCVMVGGELTLDMLDLRYNATAKFYEAPLQVKANGGVFIIDDFGRQLVQPRDLLNRWIVPLEERIDFLTLDTGKKFTVPFEELVVFATNLDPKDLADEAFLRRIRYKIYIGEPSAKAYKAIFKKECSKKQLQYSVDDLEAIIKKFYVQAKRPLRACDPRDITDWIADHCKFNNQPRTISGPTLDAIFTSYMQELR